MDPEAFRAAAHRVVDRIADYLADVEAYAGPPADRARVHRRRVPARRARRARSRWTRSSRTSTASCSRTPPTGSTRGSSPTSRRSASGAGMLGEFLTAGLGQNPMLWRTSPIGTELETVVVGWLRQALGLPDAFGGLLTDTASTSTLIALAAAREAAGLDASAQGLADRDDIGSAAGLRLRRGPQLDREGVHDAGPRAGRRREGPGQRPLRDGRRGAPSGRSTRTAPPAPGPSRSSRPSARRAPPPSTPSPPSRTSPRARASGSTSTARTPAWSRSCPDRRAPFAGWERADSIVVNPHKWLFTPLDASLLLSRRMDQLQAAFSLRPEYLRTLDREAPGPRLHRVPAAARAPDAGPQAVDAAALVRARRPAAADRAPPRRGAAVRGGHRRRPGLGAARPGAVLHGVLPLPAAPPRRPRGRAGDAGLARRHQHAPDGRGQPHRARSSCRTRGSATGSRSGSPSATCGPSRATSTWRGTCSAPRPPTLDPEARNAR